MTAPMLKNWQTWAKKTPFKVQKLIGSSAEGTMNF